MRYSEYPEYKDSGVEWLGEIPDGWEVRRLRFAVKTNPLKSELNELNADEPVSFVPMESVGEYGGLSLVAERPLEEVYSGYTYFKDKDVLIAKITPCFENGKGAIADNLTNGIGFGTTEFHVIRSDVNYHEGYLFYLTITHPFRVIGASEMFGAGGQKRIPESFIKNFRIAFPDIYEQKSIAEFLDKKTSQIDALIKKKKELIEKLKEQRMALITKAVTKGLDDTVPMKDSGVEWLGEIPMGWEVRRIKFISEIRYGVSEPPEYKNEGIKFIRATDIYRGKILLDNIKKIDVEDISSGKLIYLSVGEILVVRSGAYTGDSAIVSDEIDGSIAGFDMVLKVIDGEPKFISYALLSKYLLEGQIYLARMRAAQPHLNSEELGNFIIITPPLHVQKSIADFLDRKTSQIDALIEKVGEVIEKLKEYRITLITDAVTGKIKVG